MRPQALTLSLVLFEFWRRLTSWRCSSTPYRQTPADHWSGSQRRHAENPKLGIYCMLFVWTESGPSSHPAHLQLWLSADRLLVSRSVGASKGADAGTSITASLRAQLSDLVGRAARRLTPGTAHACWSGSTMPNPIGVPGIQDLKITSESTASAMRMTSCFPKGQGTSMATPAPGTRVLT